MSVRTYSGMGVEEERLTHYAAEPLVRVGIMDFQREVRGRLNGSFECGESGGVATGEFTAQAEGGMVLFARSGGGESVRAPLVRLGAAVGSSFTLFHVTIGNKFHWERMEDQTFQGDLVLFARPDKGLAAINETGVEDYLASVISSEMSGEAPMEFLKAHAVISRSWLLSALRRKAGAGQGPRPEGGPMGGEDELVRWYEQEDHDIYDVCADDHCQRYQGITKIVSEAAGRCIRDTYGMVLAYKGEICDTRYAKACGGLTEDFETCWADRKVPYLVSISDGPAAFPPVRTEEEAAAWIGSEPDAFCNTKDAEILRKILPSFDRETVDFFRWKAEYGREELEEILKEKSGIDFGTLKALVPLTRGPSGRISRLRIVGAKRSVVVGKELEIRRWLSRSHLLSSAFAVDTARDGRGEVRGFTLRGAGWGHGVGLCQIGAAVMATRGFGAEEILRHYFPAARLEKAY